MYTTLKRVVLLAAAALLLFSCSKDEIPAEPIPLTAVDMGLSVKWADANLGATSLESSGEFYAWGVTSTKPEYLWQTYDYYGGADSKFTKYCPLDKPDYWAGSGAPDGKTQLDLRDDVAHVKLGGTWRIPTDDEWAELFENCSWEWIKQNGVAGHLLTSKKNGASIFLPAAGSFDTVLLYEGTYGLYWSSNLYTDDPIGALIAHLAWQMVFNSIGSRAAGYPIRPVCD